MIEAIVLQRVKDHYNGEAPDLLLLSKLGKFLTEQNLWPIANDKRTLLEVAEQIPEIQTFRDDDAKSFIAVVLKGDEERAASAINERQRRSFVSSLPRALLLAFTVKVGPDQIVSVHIEQKVRFHVGVAADQGGIIVEPEFRVPGLNLIDLAKLSIADISQLENQIMAWCDRHDIVPASLKRIRVTHAAVTELAPVAPPKPGNALERLYAAQTPDVAKRLSIPIDIALALTRIP